MTTRQRTISSRAEGFGSKFGWGLVLLALVVGLLATTSVSGAVDQTVSGTVPSISAQPSLTKQRALSVRTLTHRKIGATTLVAIIQRIDVVIETKGSTVTLPPGDFTINQCVGVIPASAAPEKTCATRSVDQALPSAVSLAPLATEAIRPPSGSLAVEAILTVSGNTLTAGNTSYSATSWDGAKGSTIVVGPIGGSSPQTRGSNVVLFIPGATSARISQQLNTLKVIGARMVRTTLPWPLLEPTASGGFNPGVVNTINTFLKEARAEHLAVLLDFSGTPCWASSAPASIRAGCSPTGTWSIYPPEHLGDLATATAQVVRRWGHRLAGIELWNEPDNITFFDGSPSQYVADVRVQYRAIKKVDPRLTVLAGSLGSSDVSWLTQAYAAGLKGNFDALSVHPYNVYIDEHVAATGNPATPWPSFAVDQSTVLGVQQLHDLMVKKGQGSVPIWITEFGFSSCIDVGFLCVTQAQQADYLGTSFRLLARLPYVRVVLSYNVEDPVNNPKVWDDNFGILAYNGQPKTAATEMQVTFACLGAGDC
jgi:hypothetical protein